MSVRMKWGVFVLVCTVIFAILANIEPYRTENVLHAAMGEYDLESFQIGITDPVIWVVVAEEENEEDVRQYLERKFSRSDINKYMIDIRKKQELPSV